jgi:hypothetical protein
MLRYWDRVLAACVGQTCLFLVDTVAPLLGQSARGVRGPDVRVPCRYSGSVVGTECSLAACLGQTGVFFVDTVIPHYQNPIRFGPADRFVVANALLQP